MVPFWGQYDWHGFCRACTGRRKEINKFVIHLETIRYYENSINVENIRDKKSIDV
jgi:hypothetical protein